MSRNSTTPKAYKSRKAGIRPVKVIISDDVIFRDKRSRWWDVAQIIVPSLSFLVAGAALYWQQGKDAREESQRNTNFCLGIAQAGLQFATMADSAEAKSASWDRAARISPTCASLVNGFRADFVIKNPDSFTPAQVADAERTLKASPLPTVLIPTGLLQPRPANTVPQAAPLIPPRESEMNLSCDSPQRIVKNVRSGADGKVAADLAVAVDSPLILEVYRDGMRPIEMIKLGNGPTYMSRYRLEDQTRFNFYILAPTCGTQVYQAISARDISDQANHIVEERSGEGHVYRIER